MESDFLTLSTSAGIRKYKIDANIQESYYNNIGFRASFVFGGQWRISGAHFLDVRFGYTYQENSVTLKRYGIWNEKVYNDSDQLVYTYSKAITQAEKKTSYSQTGFVFMLGYTVGLL